MTSAFRSLKTNPEFLEVLSTANSIESLDSLTEEDLRYLKRRRYMQLSVLAGAILFAQ